MTELCLRITTKDIEVLDHGQPHGFLFIIAQVFDREAEHRDSKTEAGHQTLKVAHEVDDRRSHNIFADQLRVLLHEHANSLPQVFLHLMRSKVSELNIVSQLRVGTKCINDASPLVGPLLTTCEEN